MTLRDKTRDLLQLLPYTPTPIKIAGTTAKDLQIAIAQLAKGAVRTINCNGEVYAWKVK